jgi:hypothetical protein
MSSVRTAGSGREWNDWVVEMPLTSAGQKTSMDLCGARAAAIKFGIAANDERGGSGKSARAPLSIPC